MNKSTDVQTHSILTAKQQNGLIEAVGPDENDIKHHKNNLANSVYMRKHKTKLKWSEWQMTYKLFLVITIVLFASLSDVLICVVHADATSLIRASDDDDSRSSNSNNQKYSDLGITSDPLARDVTVATSGRNPGIYLEKIGALELNIAAVFNKVAYGK